MKVLIQQMKTWEFWAVISLVTVMIGSISMLYNSNYLAQRIGAKVDSVARQVEENKQIIEGNKQIIDEIKARQESHFRTEERRTGLPAVDGEK